MAPSGRGWQRRHGDGLDRRGRVGHESDGVPKPLPGERGFGFVGRLASHIRDLQPSLELTRGLSETAVLTQVVDCTGLSATPPAELLVNF